MKLRKYIFCIVICIVFSSSIIIAAENSSKTSLSESSKLQQKVIATFELVNKWKVTLFSRPIKYLIKRSDGTEGQYDYTLCYVGVSPADSNTVRIIWQFVFVNPPSSGVHFLPDKFVFGPADKNKFCLAFKYPYPTSSLCFFVLNPNGEEVHLYDDINKMINDKNSPNAHVENQDPNNFIQLSKIHFQNEFRNIGPELLTINSVCCYGNSAVFSLSSTENIFKLSKAKGNFILRYSIVDENAAYNVYKITDLEK